MFFLFCFVSLSMLKVNFDGPPFALVLKPTTASLSAILGKCKEKGKFLDPESQGNHLEIKLLHSLRPALNCQ